MLLDQLQLLRAELRNALMALARIARALAPSRSHPLAAYVLPDAIQILQSKGTMRLYPAWWCPSERGLIVHMVKEYEHLKPPDPGS